MSRYISYDDLDYRGDKMVGQTNLFMSGVQFMIDRINEAPSIDICFCRECKYWVDDRKSEDDMGTCGLTHYFVTADDFCSYGCREERNE